MRALSLAHAVPGTGGGAHQTVQSSAAILVFPVQSLTPVNWMLAQSIGVRLDLVGTEWGCRDDGVARMAGTNPIAGCAS